MMLVWSGNLLLALATTVILYFWPSRTHDHIFLSHDSLRMMVRRVVICCWPSPVQSFLVSGPIRSHDHSFFPRHLGVLNWGLLFSKRRGWALCDYSQGSSNLFQAHHHNSITLSCYYLIASLHIGRQTWLHPRVSQRYCFIAQS
jgi:hypothetical protein